MILPTQEAEVGRIMVRGHEQKLSRLPLNQWLGMGADPCIKQDPISKITNI
jgi:hypothetical protein